MLWRDDDNTPAYLDDDLGGMVAVVYGLLSLFGLTALVTAVLVLVALALRIG